MLHFTTKPSMHKYTLADSSRGFVKPLVLVVEDQEINADLLRQLLHKLGICCAWARNGAEAIEMFLEASPGTFQAILMDIQMPVMDGLEATRIIREEERAANRHTAVIALTAHALVEQRTHLLSSGFDGYVAKPLDIAELHTEMKRVLELPP